MLTLSRFRAHVRAIAGWCVEQDGLEGFEVKTGFYRPGLIVLLRWRDGYNTQQFLDLHRLEAMDADLGQLGPILDQAAHAARARIAKTKDPARLPG